MTADTALPPDDTDTAAGDGTSLHAREHRAERAAEAAAMRQAVAVAAFGLGRTSPAAPAGCLILAPGGSVAGQGYRLRAGDPHAAANALTAAGPAAEGGTAVLTWEPCHRPRTGASCVQLLVDAGIRRAVIAVADPAAPGAGAGLLTDAGVEVETGVGEGEALTVLGPWHVPRALGRPVVTWAYLAGGPRRRPLPRDVAEAEMLRQRADAVLRPSGQAAEAVPGAHAPRVLRLPHLPVAADPGETLAALYAGGVRALFLGGHPSIAEPFAAAGLVDRVVAYVSPLAPAEPGEALVDLLPPGFGLGSVRREGPLLRVEATRTVPAG